MRPIKLTLSAFGPYGGVESIDFRAATDAGLFGIYGPTGSGKSSIFSANAFALFGEGAKEEQGMKSMRSDFATTERLTEVTLLFELGGKRYFVKRIPEQDRPKKSGEGVTNQTHSAWLFDASDLAIDDVSNDNPGIPIVERKVSEVLKQVESLLGYGSQQFRQIVLLPQGRFERFLVSNSKDRLEILRELFDVSLYRRLTDTLKMDAVEIWREIENGYRLHGQRLTVEGFASSDDLIAGIAAALNHYEINTQTAVKKTAALKKTNDALAAATAREKLFGEVKAAAAALVLLETKIVETDAKRSRKSSAELARRMVDLDNGLIDARRRHQLANTAQSAAQKEFDRACEASTAADETLAKLRLGEPDIADLGRKVDKMNGYEKILSEAAERKEEHIKAQSALNSALQVQEKAALKQTSAERLFDQKTNEHALAQRNTLESQKLVGQREKLKIELDHAHEYAGAIQTRDRAQNDLNSALLKVTVAKTKHLAALDTEGACEGSFISAQASVLAQRLEDGQPCPVCGGGHHPQPAQGTGDAVALEKAWRDAQSNSKAAAAEGLEAQSLASSANATLEAQKALIKKLKAPERTVDKIDAEHQNIVNAIDNLGILKDVEILANELKELQVGKNGATAKLQEANLKLGTATTLEAVTRQAYADRISSVPEELRESTALKLALDDLNNDITKRKKAITDSVASQQKCSAVSTKAETELKNATTKFEECTAEIQQKKLEFKARLDELELSEAAYRAATPDIELIAELEKAISLFDNQLAAARGRSEASKNAVADAQRPNLEPLQIANDKATAEADTAAKEKAAAEQRHLALVALQSSLAEELKSLHALEESSGALRGLADTFDGQNELRINLETFAIGAMFDQVLEAANLRLDPMTKGRYRFERDTVSMGGRSKRGLDVRVHDIETGRSREIITLSGGETFIAALSLALGLSDVVEMTNGSIRLDTFSIDEGFGSLDTENDAGTLDQVLQVLQNIVGDKRAVGLISHVPLVQQAVPNGFTVLKSAGGSSIEQRIA